MADPDKLLPAHGSDQAQPGQETNANIIIPTRDAKQLPITGLGGSAGSIPALQTFFNAAKVDTGMAYVVVLHLSREHESTLASVLQRCTSMRVTQVAGKTKVEPNSVYVIPPAKRLSMMDGHLTLSELDRTPGKRVAVDLFFRTLADTHGPKACAIVLSGSDSDGAMGIKRIKEMGGLTVAQDPNEAHFDGMPRAAIATGMVDWVLPVSEMPARLTAYRKNEDRVRLPSEEVQTAAGEARDKENEDESALRETLSFLRDSTGRDFSYYKRATVLRRIGRRMQVNNVLDLPEYVSFLHTHPQELGALLQDLLISVTNFFRDKDCYASLEQNIARLFEGRRASDQIRVWVPACSTGEEAYSIAMLLSERAAKLQSPPRFQVFATDIDENALSVARAGIYPETIEADVSEERLKRFFTRENQAFRIAGSLRETVLFALHDLLKDFPFSRIDLVSCRNLLIYLDRQAQNRVFEVFHCALRPNGQLFLGSSESVEESGSLFYPLEKKAHLYLRATVPRSCLPSFPEPTTASRLLRMQHGAGHDGATAPPVPLFSNADRHGSPTPELPVSAGISWTEMHLKLIEQIAAPSVVINQNHEIVHLSKNAGRFLQFGAGEPSTNLLRVVNPLLRVDLRSALYRAAQSCSPVELQALPVEIDGVSSAIDISVQPISDTAPGYFLVLFRTREETPPVPVERAAPSSALTQLEEELERLKSRLRDTVEQSEIGSEELKSSNEELQAMNEELRSATEELETSREELQSINEELTTVNQELKSKIEEVSRSNGDLQNLMSSTNIATIFLDRELQIKRYTPTAVPLFNLIHSDVGRPLSDLKGHFDYPGLSADAERVLENLALIEREVRNGDGRWFLARLLPYRTPEDQIAGVVLTFVDITQRKLVEEALRGSEMTLKEELASIGDLHEMTMRLLNTSNLSVTLKEVVVAVTKLNETDLGSVHLLDAGTKRLSLAATCGFDPDFSRKYQSTDPAEDSSFAEVLRTRRRLVVQDFSHHGPESAELKIATEAGYRAALITPLQTRKGELLGLMSVHFRQPHRPTERDMQRTDLYARQAADLIERKYAEEALRDSEERIRVIVSQATVGIGQIDLNGRILFVNPTLCGLLEQSEENLLGKDIQELIPAEDWNEFRDSLRPLLEQGKSLDLEKRFSHKDGSHTWISLSLAMARDAQGKPQSVLSFITDITPRLENQRALKEALRENEKARVEIEAAVVAKDQFLAVLSHELRTPLTPVLVTVGSLIRRTDLSPRVREGLEMILRNVQIEAHFIDDLLDVTRISRDKFEIVRIPMDVHEAINHAIAISEADLQTKRQRLKIKLNATKQAISGDSPRIQQIIWNVLKNASKFSPDGTEISLETHNEGDQIVTVISDPGVGIDSAALPYIFDPFVQGGESVAREFGGLGLGLAISKATIDAHGGTLAATSSGRGKGAVFTIVLPLLQSDS